MACHAMLSSSGHGSTPEASAVDYGGTCVPLLGHSGVADLSHFCVSPARQKH